MNIFTIKQPSKEQSFSSFSFLFSSIDFGIYVNKTLQFLRVNKLNETFIIQILIDHKHFKLLLPLQVLIFSFNISHVTDKNAPFVEYIGKVLSPSIYCIRVTVEVNLLFNEP